MGPEGTGSGPSLLDVCVPYIDCKSWTFHTSPVKNGSYVILTGENYIDRNLLEDQELDSNVENLPKPILAWR